jgi:hypothetical protein
MEAKLLARGFIVSSLSFLFGGSDLFEGVVVSVDRQVFVQLHKEDSFHTSDEIVTSIANELIVVFVFDVHNEFEFYGVVTLGAGHNRLDVDASLHFFFLYVIKLLGGQQ